MQPQPPGSSFPSKIRALGQSSLLSIALNLSQGNGRFVAKSGHPLVRPSHPHRGHPENVGPNAPLYPKQMVVPSATPGATAGVGRSIPGRTRQRHPITV